jgi:hypothetical protein
MNLASVVCRPAGHKKKLKFFVFNRPLKLFCEQNYMLIKSLFSLEELVMTPSPIISFSLTCWSPEVAARSGSRYNKKYGSDISSCKHQPISPVAVRGGHLPITLTASPATVGNWGRATHSINKKRGKQWSRVLESSRWRFKPTCGNTSCLLKKK